LEDWFYFSVVLAIRLGSRRGVVRSAKRQEAGAISGSQPSITDRAVYNEEKKRRMVHHS
jgi:hypothetical protein